MQYSEAYGRGVKTEKKKNVNNFDVIHSNGAAIDLSSAAGPCENRSPSPRAAERHAAADLWLVIIMDIIHAPGKPISPRLYTCVCARPITFGFFIYVFVRFASPAGEPDVPPNDRVCIFRISTRRRAEIGSFRLPIPNAPGEERPKRRESRRKFREQNRNGDEPRTACALFSLQNTHRRRATPVHGNAMYNVQF